MYLACKDAVKVAGLEGRAVGKLKALPLMKYVGCLCRHTVGRHTQRATMNLESCPTRYAGEHFTAFTTKEVFRRVESKPKTLCLDSDSGIHCGKTSSLPPDFGSNQTGYTLPRSRKPK